MPTQMFNGARHSAIESTWLPKRQTCSVEYMYLVHGVDVTGVRPKTVVHRGERDARPETQRSLTVLGVHEHVHDYCIHV